MNIPTKVLTYGLNLTIFTAFLASIITIVDNPAPVYILTLILSTIGLTIMFLMHIND